MIAVQRVLPTVLIELVRKQPTTPAKVEFAWRTAVGPAVARASTVALDADGTLVVTADDRRWSHEIGQSLPLVRSRLDVLLGDALKQIAVRSHG
jgi:predicted nucleic acid-binding Zn ribbon protein